MNDDNTRQVLRSEETVVTGQPQQTTVSQTQSSATNAAGVAATPAVTPAAAPVAANQSTVQTTSASARTVGDQVVAHNVAERVVDPAAEKAATVGWINKLVWFIIGLMVALIAIRFVLMLTGANPEAGFAQLIYGIMNVMVAPFTPLFPTPVYEGAAATGRFEAASLVAIIVYILLGFLITKLLDLALGTNRTTGTVYSDVERKTRL